MISIACTKTLKEKVYKAKLAVLISIPSKRITQGPASVDKVETVRVLNSTESLPGVAGWVMWKLALHGFDLSPRRTPRSRASCSNVMGKNEPRHGRELSLPAQSHKVTCFYTNTADNEHFRGPAIAIPSVQLFITRQTCVFAGVLRWASICPLGPSRTHVLCSY